MMSMTKLGDRNYALISIGAKTFGTYEPAVMMGIFEEQLYIDEAGEIQAFLQWCHDNGKCFGHGNYEERFAEFKAASGDDQESAGEEEDEYAASEKQRIDENLVDVEDQEWDAGAPYDAALMDPEANR